MQSERPQKTVQTESWGLTFGEGLGTIATINGTQKGTSLIALDSPTPVAKENRNMPGKSQPTHERTSPNCGTSPTGAYYNVKRYEKYEGKGRDMK